MRHFFEDSRVINLMSPTLSSISKRPRVFDLGVVGSESGP